MYHRQTVVTDTFSDKTDFRELKVQHFCDTFTLQYNLETRE